MALIAAKDVKSMEHKIEQAAREAESLIKPAYATEEGFISVAEPAITYSQPRVNEPDATSSSLEQPSLAYSALPTTPLGSRYDSSELDSEPFIPEANRPGMDYRPAPFWHLFSFSGRFVIGTLAVVIVAAALLVLVDRPKTSQPSSTSLDNQQTVIGSTTVGDHVLRINFDTQLANGKQLTATGPVVIQNQSDSTGALKVQSADGSNILVANTLDKTITIGDKPPGNVSLNVSGDITTNGSLVSTTNGYSLSSGGLTIGGVLVCTARGCVSSSSPSPTPANPTIDVANLAYLNVNQTFSGQNSFKNTSATAFQVQNSGGTDDLFVADTVNNRIGIGTTPSASGATLQVAGDLNVSSGVYRIGNVAGANLTCGPNELLQQGVISGGIITSGSCVTVAGASTPTLQQVYDASTPSSITLSNASGVLQIQDAASPLATDLFEVTNNGASTKYFAVNSLGISITGNINTTGQYQINGSQISSANLSDGAQLAKAGANNTFTGNNTFSSASNSYNGDGSGITNLNAASISSGTLNDLRLSANVTLQGNSFNGASQLVQLTAGGILPILSGANLTSLNAASISSGTLNDLRLSANVAKLASNQTFTGNNTFILSSTALTVQDAASPLGTDLFTVTDNSGSTKYFEVSATTAKVNGNDICTSAGNCVGVLGGSIGGSGTAGKLAEFTGSGFTIGDSPITDSGSVLTLGEDTTINGTLGANTISPTATMTVGVASQTLTLQGDASTSLSATSSGVTNSLVFATPSSSGKTITLPDASGTAAVSASGPLALDAAGNLTCPTCLTSGGGGGTAGVSSINTQTGAITLAGTANQITITASGGPTFTFSTPQDINTNSSPTFANINLGSGGAYKINGSQISSAALSNDSNITKLNATQTFTGANTSAPTTDITGFSLKQTTAASPTSDVFDVTDSTGATKYLAVDSSGNASASGTFNATVLQQAGTGVLLENTTFGGSGGDITGTYDNLTIGTGAVTSAKILDGTIANVDINNAAAIAYGKLNLNNSIVNSDIAAAANISDSKLATITSAGKVADSALSSNVALLNANQTFIGNNTYTGTVAVNKTNTAAFQIQNASTPDDLFIADTSNHRIAIDQASASYPLDVSGDINTTTGYRVAGTPGSGITCSSGNVIQNATVSGGIITGGSCIANGAGATTTLQDAYNNSSSPATITTTSAAKGILLKAGPTFDSSTLFQVQNANGNDYLQVDTLGATLSLGNTGIAGTIQVGNTTGAVAQTIDIGNNATASSNTTAVLGSSIDGSTTTIQSGSGGLNLNPSGASNTGVLVKPGADSTVAFQIQNAAGTSSLLTADTTNMRLGVDVSYVSLGVPSGLTVAAAGSGSGNLSNGTTYYYKVTAIDNMGGETTVSTEQSATATATKIINLYWTAVSGATGYKIYRSTSSNTEVYLTTVKSNYSVTNPYQDTGSITAGSATPPSSNTAYVSTNNSNNLGQISIGGLGTPAGQLYVSGIIPKDLTSGGVGSLSPGNSYDKQMDIAGSYLYIVDRGNKKLKVFDVTNPSDPVDVTNGGVSTTDNPVSVAVQGRYAYVLENLHLQIFDISNPASPTDVTGGGFAIGHDNNAWSQDIYVEGRYAFITGHFQELHVLDISNPAKPLEVQDYTSLASSVPYAAYVQGKYLYTGGSTAKFQIINISNPSNVSDISSGGISTSSAVNTIAAEGNYVFVGNQNGELQVFDVSNPTAGVDLTNGGLNLGSNIEGIAIQGHYAYVANSNNKIYVLDITNPGNPVDVSSGGASTNGTAYSMKVQGRYAYVLNSNNKLQVFDLGGAYIQQLEAGGAQLGSVSVSSDASVGGNAIVNGGLQVGQSAQISNNLSTGGSLAVQGSASISGGIIGGLTLNSPLATPGLPTLNIQGSGGSTSYSYAISAVSASGGETLAGTANTTSSGNATLTSTNFIQIDISPVTGAAYYKVYRTASGGTPSSTGLIGTTSSLTFDDTGLTASGSSATINTTGNFTVNGNQSLFKPTTDNTTAFQIQNASSGSLFAVDSINSAITVDGNASGQLGSWATNTNNLPAGKTDAATVMANGYIYVIGGNPSTTVYYAKLNADGSTGLWQTDANSLPLARGSVTAITANNYVYAIGGYTGGSVATSTVYYAQLNNDGSTGVWNLSPNGLPVALYKATSIVANGYAYVMGGDTGAAVKSTVYYAKLNADGTTGIWNTNNNALPANRAWATSAVANGYVYVLGGYLSGTSAQTSVYYAQLNTNGSTSGWTTSGNTLLANRMNATTLVSNGYIYEIGGEDSTSTFQSTVYYAKLNTDGSIGSWNTNTNALPVARGQSSAAAANGYIYNIGGSTNGTTIYYASASRVQLGANLDLVGLQSGDGSAGGNLTAANGTFGGNLQVQGTASFAQGVSIAGNLTNSGSALFQSTTGLTNAFQIQSTTGSQAVNVNTSINPDLVSNGDFESTTSGWSGKGSATIARNDTSAIGAASGVGSLAITTTAAANDGASFNYTFAASTQYTLSLYARSSSGTVSTINIGHQDASGTDLDCLAAQTITTTWTRFTCTFSTGSTITPPTQIYIKQSDATARTFYIDGVQLEQAGSASAFQASQANFQVQTSTSTITLDGSDTGALGPWTTNVNSLPAVRTGITAVTANGYAYILGGCTATSCTSGVSSTVYYSKLNADGSLGSWTTSSNPLLANRGFAGTVVANGYIYEIGGCNGVPAVGCLQSTVYYAKLNADGSTGAWQTNANALPLAMYDFETAVSNGYVYVMGGWANVSGTGTNQSTVYYAKLNADGSTGAWQTNANALPSANSADNQAFIANGYIYYYPQSTNFYYAKLNSDGSTGTWNTTANLVSPNSRAYSNEIVANGYAYVIDGYQGAIQTTVFYSKLISDGSTGSYSTNTNSLPSAREAAGSFTANGYVYVIGGDDSSSAYSTVYYASTARVQIGANIDLVGLQGGTLADDGSQSQGSVGGSITAGSGTFVGSLQVQGAVNFAQGANIIGNFTLASSTGVTLLAADPGNQTITINGALTVAGNITISSGALITSSTGMYGTSLPGSPVNGQEFYYIADNTNHIVWHVRYNSSSGYWEFLGGSPLNISATTATLPNAGDYTINFGWTFTGGNNGYSGVSLSTGSGTLSGHTSAGVGGGCSCGGTTSVSADVTGFAKATGVSASDVISHTSPSGGNAVSGEWYEVTPIRIQ